MRLEDGVLTLHQSDINDFMQCPEKFRLSNGLGPEGWYDPDEAAPRVESDAALIGTCLHALIERELTKGPFASLSSAKGWTTNWMGNEIARFIADEIEYRAETYGGDPEKTMAAVHLLVESWWHSNVRSYWLRRERETFLVEHEFDVPFVSRPGKMISEIRLAGTSDIIDLLEHRVVDWKSASREYKRWEKQRWAFQPTVYTFAAADQGLIKPKEGLYQFDYNIFVRGSKPAQAQEVTVYRGTGQWAWATRVVNNIATLMESDAEEWPLNDGHVLCSPKWCPLWYSCKGDFVTEEWT